MAAILKIVSAVYLIFVWLVLAMVLENPNFRGYGDQSLTQVLAFLTAIGLSIPAVALYAFGQVVGDVRVMREHLRVMRRYYEPDGRSKEPM